MRVLEPESIVVPEPQAQDENVLAGNEGEAAGAHARVDNLGSDNVSDGGLRPGGGREKKDNDRDHLAESGKRAHRGRLRSPPPVPHLEPRWLGGARWGNHRP